MCEYIIISKEFLQTKLDECNNEIENVSPYSPGRLLWLNAEIKIYNLVLSQSIPLIPEIEKAFNVGISHGIDASFAMDRETDSYTTKLDLEDYISQLDLNYGKNDNI